MTDHADELEEQHHAWTASATEKLRSDDETVLNDILARCGARIQRALRLRFPTILNDADTEDVLSIALFRLWRNRMQFDPSQSRLDTWLYLLARNAAIDLLRSRNRITGFDSLPLDENLAVPESKNAAELEDASSLRPPDRSKPQEDLRRALQRLSPTEQRILLSAQPPAELCSDLHMNPNQLRVKRFRSMQKLKRILMEMGHNLSEGHLATTEGHSNA